MTWINEAPCRANGKGAGIVTPTFAPRSLPQAIADAQAGKAIAMLLYNCGARSLAKTQAAFVQHPEWAAA